MTGFLDIFKHLLPRARAWRLTSDKPLRQFFDGLTGLGSDIKQFFDLIWFDVLPQSTRELDSWEEQFGLPDTGLTEQERRDRLDATWKALGGQDPKYIQDTLRNAGFDVYVHEWWEPGTEPAPGVKACATPRNPLLYLRRGSLDLVYAVGCGEPNALCGEQFALCGNTLQPPGYPLVNKVFSAEPKIFTLCGEPQMLCGEPDALCGNFFEFRNIELEYIVPDDPNKWPYFWYVGGAVFGDLAQVDPKRRDEFEALCLKIGPAHTWIGVLVEYV